MKTETSFDFGIQDYTVRRLHACDIPAMQKLFEKCADYMLLVGGHLAGPTTAEEDFYTVPPGRSPDEKIVFGVFHTRDDLVGMLDVLASYPDESSWWIGLLLLVPEIRSLGIGQKLVKRFIDYARARGAESIMLGVVEDNKPAYRFWTHMGFEWVRRTEPRQFGDKSQVVDIMRRTIMGEEWP